MNIYTCHECGASHTRYQLDYGWCGNCGAQLEAADKIAMFAESRAEAEALARQMAGEETVTLPAIISESEASYSAMLRGPVRGLWSGVISIDQFFDSFAITVERGLTQAWKEGALECGITMDELTPEERMALMQFIVNQKAYIFRFGLDIEEHSKAKGYLLQPHFGRLAAWINQYESVRMRAASMACGNKKKKWVLGMTEKHCQTCFRLNGRVKRYSYWAQHVLPRNAPNPKLKCGGWLCDCRLDDTTDPLSKGPLPFGL